MYKVLICIPFMIFVAAAGLQVYMLHEKFDRIANNDVGPGYNSIMYWICLTHVIFAMVLWYNMLLVNMLAIQLFVSLVLLTFNVGLHKWLYLFITDG